MTFIDPEKVKDATPIVLKEMNLHEMKVLGHLHILRVWGGWIYWSFVGTEAVTGVFVPQGNIEDYEEEEHENQIPPTKEEMEEAIKRSKDKLKEQRNSE